MAARTPQEQFEIFRSMLASKRGLSVEGALFEAVLTWLRFPLEVEEEQRKEIAELTCQAFGITYDDLMRRIVGGTPSPSEGPPDPVSIAVRRERELQTLLPKRGFFADYCRFTLNSEAPLVYHIFCALAGVAATVNRRVHFNLGTQSIYPPLGVLILGPSGIKKTSAADIIVDILNEMQLTPVYAEKLTPEALIDSMKGGNATGLVYSPEMTVLISRQRYMESIIPLLTRFMDSPNLWKSETIMRGKGVLHDVAITCLMCSTLDWFIKNTPETLFGGGFIARNIMVLQEYSTRVIALPKPQDAKLREKLILELASLHEFQGEMSFDKEARDAHIELYEHDKVNRIAEHEILETYYQRKHSHLIRVSMCLHLAECKDLTICYRCWKRALDILNWTERFLPTLAARMFKNTWGEDQDLLIKKIHAAGGSIRHTDLIRRLQYRMSASQVRSLVGSLKEAGLIKEHRTAIDHVYTLTELIDGDL
jgi:hypothetical protein